MSVVVFVIMSETIAFDSVAFLFRRFFSGKIKSYISFSLLLTVLLIIEKNVCKVYIRDGAEIYMKLYEN